MTGVGSERIPLLWSTVLGKTALRRSHFGVSVSREFGPYMFQLGLSVSRDFCPYMSHLGLSVSREFCPYCIDCTGAGVARWLSGSLRQYLFGVTV